MGQIIFRVDASETIGIGHVVRCLTLADALTIQGKRVVFFCQLLPGNIIEYIRQKGYSVEVLNSDLQNDNTEEMYEWLQKQAELIQWLIVDHYHINAEWERKLRPYINHILVIDDLADRQHDCDILLDQNYYFQMETRYNGLLPPYCRQLLGPEYCLLRQEFILARQHLRKRSGIVKRILIFFGGSDPTGETVRTLKVLNGLSLTDIIVDVVVGLSNYRRTEIQTICQDSGFNYYCQINHIAELMAQADLAVGAGGTATWERCSLGLPAIVIEVAENQREVTQAVASTGAIINMGWAEQVTDFNLATVLQQCLSQPEELRQMSHCAMKLMSDVSSSGVGRIMNVMEAIDACI